ncbi:MAG: DUF2255 family protein [Ardenticatenaceae bacterium]|nr:DUF2255 family protein [Ardenticatenaceae bacterium]
MSVWTNDELNKIGTADELQIAPRRQNGTLRRPITIWVVRVGAELYVRSYNGPNGSWFRAARRSHEGHIRAGGVQKDVTFVAETDAEVNSKIDAAYGEKYGRYPQYVAPMLNAAARSTTINLFPKDSSS